MLIPTAVTIRLWMKPRQASALKELLILLSTEPVELGQGPLASVLRVGSTPSNWLVIGGDMVGVVKDVANLLCSWTC